MDIDTRAQEILRKIYNNDTVYLRGIRRYSAEEKLVVGVFLYPSGHDYTKVPMPYVAATQSLVCINQLGYVLSGLLVQDGCSDFDGLATNAFNAATENHRTKLGEVEIQYHREIPKDEEFEVAMQVARIKEWGGLKVVIVKFGGPTLDEAQTICGQLKFVGRI